MKRYRTVLRLKKRNYYLLLIFAALIYSAFLCVSGIRAATAKQMQEHLYSQMQQAVLQILAGEENQVFVHLRRDRNDDITAITVNGILLSQLQMRYHEALTTSPAKCSIRLTAADLLGSRLFAFIPGSITLSCAPETEWEAAVVSRTLENDEKSRQFQLVLMTKGIANHTALFHAELEEEILLYETVIYTAAT